MTDQRFSVKFWGTRGSIPVSGDDFVRYGGNTPCLEVRCGEHILIFDAGSGIMGAGQSLLGESVSDINVFFSHCHYDHIIGLPFFKPIYNPAITVTFWSGHMAGQMTTGEMIRKFISPPFFPINVEICTATLKFSDFHAGEIITPKPGIVIKTFTLNHPGGCIGYRVEWAGKALALVFDIEHEPGILDPTALALMEGADVVVYDSAFTEAEMQRYRGFGHSTWEQGVKLMQASGAKKLVLFHHAPSRTDSEMALLERLAQEAFPDTVAGFDGMVLDIR